MGFIMHGLEAEKYDREYSDLQLLKRILRYFSPYKRMLLWIITALLISSLTQTLVPLVISVMLDDLRISELSRTLDPLATAIIVLSLSLLVFYSISFFASMFQQIFTARATQSAVVDLRKEAFDAILKRDMSFLSDQPTGKLVSRVQNDTNDFGQTITLTTSLMAQVLVVVFLLYFLFDKSPRLTAIVLVFAPLVVGTALMYRKIARTVAREGQRILALINAAIQEVFSGIYVAKSFRAEQRIYEEFGELNSTSYVINLKRGFVFSSIFPILSILTGIGTALLIFFGGLDVLGSNDSLGAIIAWLPGEQITVGEWFLFLQGLQLFFFPLMSIASFWSQFQQGLAATERVFALVDAENTVVQHDNKRLKDPSGGAIEFRNLTFGYNDSKNVLEAFSLKIKPGERIAIVGHTGAGKSTIVKLVSRSYEFQGGELLIDGQDIRSLDLAAYRRSLAIITQEVFLWNSTIRENLLYGSHHIPDAEKKMEKILKELGVMDWIERLPDGLNSYIGERGGRLSMGQRQLIAFARILLLNPLILIMDEATASVDPF
ncbi:MAG TPA: ABC transporter ATP-binding protein, partial [Candidatus Hodarchaeales archaeon]|nr:ABC transporter ATP-binding protein [Candidatus Hodarchaeales archaeon]